jgi:hypothetical protein
VLHRLRHMAFILPPLLLTLCCSCTHLMATPSLPLTKVRQGGRNSTACLSKSQPVTTHITVHTPNVAIKGLG